MKCPHCSSSKVRKFGKIKGKQRDHCRECDRYFQSHYESKGYSPEVKEICLKMYLNGMGFRGIERVTGIHHTTIMNWVKELGEELSTEETEPPQVVSLDELQTYIGRKTNKIWIWTAINYYLSGILAFVIGDRSSLTFNRLKNKILPWESRRYLTDGYCVYSLCLALAKHQVSPKTRLTRVEGENTRLRHYIARLHRATLCYSKSIKMLEYPVRLLIYYLREKRIPIPTS